MKKLLSAALTAAIMCTAFNYAYAKQADIVSYEAGMKTYEEMAECLAALGGAYYEAGTDLSVPVTREQFCEIIIKYLGLQGGAGSDTELTPFIDVEPSRPTYGAVKTMYTLGYMVGDDTRHFYPENNISVVQAATVAVKLLGYGYEAESLGGYPAGSMAEAYNREILTEKYDDYNKPITLGSVYKMLYDMLEIPIMELQFEGSKQKYTRDSNTTILDAYFETEKLKGKVTANRYTGLVTDTAALPDNQIGIDDVSFHAVNNYDSLLGMNVVYFISYKNLDDGEIVYMTPEFDTVTTIDSDDIKEITPGKLTYWSEDEGSSRTKSINLDSKLDVIYNGVAYTGYGILSDIELKNGYVRFIDNNRDGKADVMDVTEYVSYLIDGINKTDKIIYDYDKNIDITLDNTEDIVEIFNSQGGAEKFSALKKNMLVSIAASKDAFKPVKRVYICDTVIEGSVERINDNECVVAGTTLKIAPDLNKQLSLNMSGIFYIDINGKLAAFKSSKSSDFTYGVVYKCWYDNEEEQTGLKIFTESEKFEGFFLKDKISINGTNYKAATSTGGNLIANTLQIGTVIRYKLGDNGEIAKIEFPLAMITDRGGNKSPADSDDFRTLYEGSSFKYRNGMFDGKVVITDNTVIFSVPKSSNWSDTDIFGTLSTKSFSGGTSYSKNYKAYVVGESPVSVADVMIVEDMTKGSIGNTTNMVFVTDVGEGLDPENDICQVIKGVSGGNTVEYYCVDDTIIAESALKRGDVIRVGVNSANKVNKVEKIYNADGSNKNGALLVPDEGISENTASFDSEYRVAIGTVQDVEDGYMRFSMRKISGEKFFDDPALCRTDGATIIKYDTKNTRNHVPSPCSVNEILRGDTVIIRMNLAAAKEIIIIR